MIKARFEEFLGEFVYGAIDGTVTTFAVVASATGAQLSSTVVIILGLANLLGDGFSMGASAYLSAKSELDLKKRNHNDAGKKGELVHGDTPMRDGVITFLAFLLVGFVPLLIYVADAFLQTHMTIAEMFIVSSVLTAVTFVAVGWLKAHVTRTNPLRAVAETVLLGSIAAGLAYGLGDVLGNALRSR